MHIFCIFVFSVIIYHYFIFPIIIFMRAKIMPYKLSIGDIKPKVSLIIAAYNEEKVIKEKIKNTFNLEYPSESLEVIIVSDGSTDRTPQIVAEFSKQGIISIHSPPRKGKTSALNRAVNHSTGEIIIFSDANSMYKADAVNLLVRNFHDKKVGGVCGRKSIIKNIARQSSKGDRLFWDLESIIKTWQSKTGSISNADGEIFAMRRSLYQEIPEEIINDDQTLTFDIINKGYRVIYEPNAISHEEASIILDDDFKVKARMVTGGFQTLFRYKTILFPPKSYFAFQFFSHKILRYLMPFLLLTLFTSNIFATKGAFRYLLVAQVLFYISAIIGLIMKKMNLKQGPFYIPYYYCLMNIAAIYGFFYFLKGTSGVAIWKKAAR